MGGACGTCGGEERCMQCFGGGTPKDRGHVEDIGVDDKIILKRIYKR